MVYHQGGYICAERHEVMVHYFRLPESASPKGTVFILHGYFDHVGLYTQLIDRCLGAGFDVLPTISRARIVEWHAGRHWQFPGVPGRTVGSNGEGQGQDSGGAWYAVGGQSTGGAILIDYLLSNHHNRESSAFRKVVLLAPLVRPMGWLGGAKILHSLVKPFLTRWKRVFGPNSGDTRFLRFLREHDPLQARAVHVDWVTALRQWVPHIESARPVDFPVTVVQGEKDLTVDWQHNLRIIRNKFSSVKERRIPDGRHHLVNEAQDLQATVFNTIIDTFSE